MGVNSSADDYIVRGSLSGEVERTLRALDFDPKDAGLRRLAEVYAAQLDNARGMAHVGQFVLEEAMRSTSPNANNLVEMVAALQKKLDEQIALKDIGARLENTLAALGATPAARAKIAAPVQPRTSRLEAFRGGA